MTLDDILDYIATEYLDDRTELLDGDPDSLWSDRTIIRYWNEGARILCRRSWVLIDTGHADAGVITLAQTITTYDLHPSVVRVLKATPEDSEIPLHRTTDSALDLWRGEDPDYFDINETLTTAPGYPKAFATDAGARQLRVFPPPSVDEDGLRLVLKVARMPVCELDVDKTTGQTQVPEIPEEWHLAVSDYAAGRCLMMPKLADMDARAEGRQLVQMFNAAVREARQERQRAELAPPRFLHDTTTA